jgi:hypothetical protein
VRVFEGLLLLVLAVALPAAAADAPASLERGYRLMYGLDFPSAEREFVQWQREHPGDALGRTSVAANLLFAEFDRAGILQAQFFTDDSSFTAKKTRVVDPAVGARFDAAVVDAEALAKKRLAADPRDREALLALTMIYGLRSDYAALIEGRNLAALSYTRQAAAWARQLLTVSPGDADAYLATGMSEYIVGSLPAPARWLLRIAGYKGDKAQGMVQLKVTAGHGRYLAPLARILLAIAYLRDHDAGRARELLVALARDFPSNPLFPREIQRIDRRGD